MERGKAHFMRDIYGEIKNVGDAPGILIAAIVEFISDGKPRGTGIRVEFNMPLLLPNQTSNTFGGHWFGSGGMVENHQDKGAKFLWE